METRLLDPGCPGSEHVSTELGYLANHCGEMAEGCMVNFLKRQEMPPPFF
jgi:hypothetical protein